MRYTFREFVNSHPCSIKLREETAAPPVGDASAPANPDNTTNQYHYDSLKRGLGIDDKDMDAALTGSSTTVWSVPNYSR